MMRNAQYVLLLHNFRFVFWTRVVLLTSVIFGQITERDEAALKALKDIKWINLEDNKGFKLDFYFDTNPYFKNTVVCLLNCSCAVLFLRLLDVNLATSDWFFYTLVNLCFFSL